MATCLGCGMNANLVKSHIIPEAFFRAVKKTQGEPVILSGEKGEYPKKSHIGIYDNNILCHRCEDVFQKTDDYGIKTLINEEDRYQEILVDGRLAGYERVDYEYSKLKLFFISLIWRASITSQPK